MEHAGQKKIKTVKNKKPSGAMRGEARWWREEKVATSEKYILETYDTYMGSRTKLLPYTNFYVEVLTQFRIKLLHVEVLTKVWIKLLHLTGPIGSSSISSSRGY